MEPDASTVVTTTNPLDQPPPVTVGRVADLPSNSIGKYVNIDSIRIDWLKKIPQSVQDGKKQYMRIDTKAQRFPSWKELNELPVEVRESIEATALSVLHFRLLPILIMFLRKQTKARMLKAALSHSSCGSTPTTNFLSSVPAFARWENLDGVIKALTPHLFVQDEVVVHYKEKESCALAIVTFGIVAADKEQNNLLAAPSCVGQVTAHTGHRQRSSVRCISNESIVWFLSYKAYQELLHKTQLGDVIRYHTENAFLSRERQLKSAFADLHTTDALQTFAEFDMLPYDTVEDQVRTKMQAKVYKAGNMLYKATEPASSLIYLVQGTVAIHKDSTGLAKLGYQTSSRRRSIGLNNSPGGALGAHLFGESLTPRAMNASSVSPAGGLQTFDLRGQPLPVGTFVLDAPCVLGDLSWIQSSKRKHSCLALTHCDTLVVTKESMKLVISGMDTATLLKYKPPHSDVKPMGISTSTLTPAQIANKTPSAAGIAGAQAMLRRGSQLSLHNTESSGRRSSVAANGRRGSQSAVASSKRRASVVEPAKKTSQESVKISSLSETKKPTKKPKQELGERELLFMKYVPYVRSIPLLSHLLPPEDDEKPQPPIIQELAEAFSPLVFPPKSTVTSATEVCDKIMFLLGGRAIVLSDETESLKRTLALKAISERHKKVAELRERNKKSESSPERTKSLQDFAPAGGLSMTGIFGGGTDFPSAGSTSDGRHQESTKKVTRGGSHQISLAHEECIGYPVLSPHKWLRRVIAAETVECIQLSFHDYERILAKYGLKQKVAALSHALLNPALVSESANQEAVELVTHLKNPVLYSTKMREPSELKLCRYPTETQLKRLAPIPLQNRLSTCVFGGASMSRFSAEKVTTIETGEKLQPIVLGKHNKLHLEYKEKLPTSQIDVTGSKSQISPSPSRRNFF